MSRTPPRSQSADRGRSEAEEIRRRLEEVTSGRVSTVSIETVMRRVREKLVDHLTPPAGDESLAEEGLAE